VFLADGNQIEEILSYEMTWLNRKQVEFFTFLYNKEVIERNTLKRALSHLQKKKPEEEELDASKI